VLRSDDGITLIARLHRRLPAGGFYRGKQRFSMLSSSTMAVRRSLSYPAR
jgi:hypothetical protein